MRSWWVRCLFWLLCYILSGCSDNLQPQWFETENPKRLSQWQLFKPVGNKLVLAKNTRSYTLSSSLFSDYAAKFRTLSLPDGQSARLQADGSIVFPNGTIISKTFYYPENHESNRQLDINSPNIDQSQLMETRLLVKRSNGWEALPYVWQANQKEAVLKRAGAILRAKQGNFNYVVPNVNQCAGCHQLDLASKQIKPIGPNFRNLPKQQLQQWLHEGWLQLEGESDSLKAMQRQLVANIDWRDTSQTIDMRARSYLDINCGHCHSATGPADTSGLILTNGVVEQVRLGVCKAPIAAGQGTGGNHFSIVPGQPEESILLYRMESTDPGAMMPELGRTLAHTEGIALIRQWIMEMRGSCKTKSAM